MKTGKFITLALFVFSSMFLQFCNQQCGNKQVQNYEIENYIYYRTYKKDNIGNTNIQKEDSIVMSAADTIYLILNSKTRVAAFIDRSLCNGSLYACDPVAPTYHRLGDSMRITTIDDFDATHPAGSSVNDLFLIYDEFACSPKPHYMPVSDYRNISPYEHMLTLALLKKPSSGNLRLRFSFHSGISSSLASSDGPLMKFY
jgi:hypothetical protein